MGDDAAMVVSKPVWIDLSSADPAASRAFYAGLFGWDITVSPDPQYGGYAMATVGGKDVAGIGPPDAERVATDVQAAGGAVVAPPFDVGDQGRMAVFQDPTGAFISAWQPKAMAGFRAGASNMFVWAELNSRGIERAVPFYERVFGWSHATQPMGEGMEYTEFHLGSDSIAGGVEMNPMVPAAVPSYWMVYFGADDVDAAFEKAIAAGAHEMLPPRDFPGGRFAILGDPQGAAFGVLKMARR